MVGVTSQQRMLTPLQNPILPLVFPGVHVSLIFTGLFQVPGLDTGFDREYFLITWLDSPILAADCSVH
jgi:hypothetical protein